MPVPVNERIVPAEEERLGEEDGDAGVDKGCASCSSDEGARNLRAVLNIMARGKAEY
jgi:hypothetical protein